MKKIFIIPVLALFLFIPFFGVQAEQETDFFKAEVIDILEQKEIKTDNGFSIIKQNLLLVGLEKEWNDKEFTIKGIDGLEVLSSQEYEIGDKLIISHNIDFQGNDSFVIIDYYRISPLVWLLLIFVLIMLLVGGFKGFKSLLSLGLSIFVILGFIVPRIFNGSNPILVAIIGSIFLILLVIYITEGWNKKSHLAVISMAISLFITGLLSWIFVKATALTGASSEEILYLIDSSNIVNLRGLLLAGIILGTIGVLDDLVISQIVTVEQIKISNQKLGEKEIFSRARKVGVSHLASMTNTLFLAYAGVALPLLLLFYVKQPPFMSVEYVLNSEIIATEIVRTLIGVIGLLTAMPISTWFASKYLSVKN